MTMSCPVVLSTAMTTDPRDLLDYDPDLGVFRWRFSRRGASAGKVAGNRMSNGYIMIETCGSRYLAHRLAWFFVTGEWPSGHLDHIDGDPSNNRISNLRIASASQNAANKRRSRNNTSGFKGVHLDGSGRWRAAIKVDGKRTYLGSYDSPEDAHRAYVEAAERLFGEYARPG